MITHAEFARMRLSDFVREVEPLDGWEYMGRIWVGEAVGFTEWLRPSDNPERLGSLALDLTALDRAIVERVLRMLGLPVAAGMTGEEIRGRLGEPLAEQSFVSDRRSYDFVVGVDERFDVSCTIQQNDGLIYLVVRPVAP